ncbi:MAG: SEC-C metal-binding domain-containing protein, partial [Mucinivorans sp.]
AAGDTEKGGILLYRAHKGLPKSKALIKFLSEQGNRALMLKTENTFMQDNSKRMHEITDDLFFIIDEKQNAVELTDKGHDTLSGKYEDKRFFIMPDIGSEIASLEHSSMSVEQRLEAKDKLLGEYSIKSERLHTVNQLLKAYAMFENNVEYIVQDNKVKIVDEQTGRILDGRRYSDGLHQAIEAKEHVRVEAATQTFATVTLQNYFRMYHKLAGMTGTAETEASELWNIYKLDVVVIPTNRPISRTDHQDLIYKTKREKYAAVIDQVQQLIDAGRPVLVGTTSVEISELLSKMMKLRGIKHNVLNAKQHQSEAMIVQQAGQSSQVTIATNMAGRGTDIKLSDAVKQAGGLAIVGTERHESRRVDRQLRGRAGRQGDPGSSQFFVSLEDDLMRLFGSERISKLMDTMGIKEGESIQAGMMTKAIERAQRKVEENNFGMRKRLLEYDDVMNSQREVVYRRRRHALYGERIEVDLMNMMGEYAQSFVQNFRADDFEQFKMEMLSQLGIEPSFDEAQYGDMSDNNLADILSGDMMSMMRRRTDAIAALALPVLENVYKEQGDHYENISIPLTDGRRGLNIPVNLKKAVETRGAEIGKELSKVMMLITIDENWKEHLRDMDDLKQSVQNASYEQKDPLLIYKFESFELFKTMIDKVSQQVLSMLLKAYLPMQQNPTQPNAAAEAARKRQIAEMARMQTSRAEAAQNAGSAERSKPAPVQVEKSVGRNDPCPCGSGKKYKQCHGASHPTA